jgi:hypothetical protein
MSARKTKPNARPNAKTSRAKASSRRTPKGAKAKVARKQAAGGRRGQAKARIFELLREEHRMAMEMLEEICEGGLDEEERPELFAELRAALMSHALAESRAFYAPLKQQASEPDKVLEADAEHVVAERLIEDLSGTRLDAERWMARAKVLKEVVRHHIEEEEGELFPLAQESCDEATLEEMADNFEAERGRLVDVVA